jgi:RNA polymerase sigma factor (sigma-70 family)
MRLQTNDTEGPRSPMTTCAPRQYFDLTSSKGAPVPILCKVQRATSRQRRRVNDGQTAMSNSSTRGSLIVGVCEQNPERWREFDSIYRPMLFASVRKQGLNDVETNDVVQDTFVKLLGKIHAYDHERCKFRTWLFTIAHNTLVDFARRRATQRKAVDGWVAAVLHSSESESVKMADQWAKLHRTKILHHALKKVRARTAPRTWACFEQRLLRDRPGALIAAELGLGPSTVFVNACRVLKRVRAVCEEFDEDMSHAFDSSLSRGE